MNKKQLNVPKLRFKGYLDPWMHRKIRITGNVYMGHNVDKSKLDSNGKYPVVANGLKNDGIVGYYNDYQIKAPAVTVTSRRYIGHAKTRFNSFTPTNRLIVYKSKNMDPIFFANAINNTHFIADNLKMPQLTFSQFKEQHINFPNLKEQKAIGRFIQLFDKKISLQKMKIKQFCLLKQAYLQKLLIRNDATIPELRFKQFHSEWKIRKLKDITDYRNNRGIEKEFVKDGKYKVISIGSYSKDNKYIDQALRANATNNVKSQLVQSGELIMLLNDVTRGNILGKTLLIRNNDEYVANQRTETIIPNKKVSSLFLYHQFNNIDFRRKIISLSQGIAQSYVNYRTINNLRLHVPNKEEGDAIGKLLDKIDRLLLLSEKKLSCLKSLKCAYIQKML